MRVAVKVVIVLAVFIACASVVEYLAGAIPGTPAHRLSALPSTTETIKFIASDSGQELVTGQGWWVLLVFLPVAAVVSAVVGRAIDLCPRTSLVAIGLLIAARATGILLASQAYSNSELSGLSLSLATPVWGFLASLLICLALAAAVVYTPARRRHGLG